MRTLISSAVAGLLVSMASFNAFALPAAPLEAGQGSPDVTLVAEGCGWGFHRVPGVGCVRNAGGPGVVVAAPAVVAAPLPGVVVTAPAPVVVERGCGPGRHWAPYWRRCVWN
jgi:hypothetical protein